ncbi:MAG: hypothetical protein CVT59_11255 [Actinobacteria bacterium HGW-Actinobacteria-1]|nr:MAG: hypothetical protein CVT59_11255 [Actinobacteria bacterium HGW-Actinobacteria-1]
MNHVRTRLLTVALVVSLVLTGGCSAGMDSADVPGALESSSANLSTPEDAVLSYLSAVSRAYATGDSEVASQTMTPEEGVRIDSYIQFNAQQQRGIEQRLRSFTVGTLSEESTQAVLTASEEWTYRYFVPETGEYSGPELSASYETTYTLVRVDRGWVVAVVEASSRGEVK